MIFGEYEQYHDFWYDFNNILFREMYFKVSALPNFGEILSLRSRYIKGEKMIKEERRYAEKILNEEIIHFMDQRKNDVATIQEQKVSENLSLFKKIQEKNKRKEVE